MVGLCMGGQDTCLIETSLRDFESWRKRRRLEPSVANLDIYVNKTRRARNSAVSSFHAEGACEPSPPSRPKIWSRGRVATAGAIRVARLPSLVPNPWRHTIARHLFSPASGSLGGPAMK